MEFKVNVMELLANCARELTHTDSSHAYVLLEFANNLAELMHDPSKMDEFKAIYVGEDRAPFDLEKMFPAREDE